MKTKKGKFLVVILILAVSLACATPMRLLATQTPTAATASATETQVPTATPSPTVRPPTPTPEIDQCQNLENKIFLYNNNLILKDFETLDNRAMQHFPGDGVIIIKGLSEDTEKIRDILVQVEGLKAPPYLKQFHDLEIGFLSSYVTALDAALSGDSGRTFVYLEETQRYYDLFVAEIERLQAECPNENDNTGTT